MWAPCLYRGRPLSHSKKLQTGIFGFSQKESCTLLVPSLKITDPIFLEIFLIQFQWTVYDVITTLICIIQKPEYL